MKGKGEADLYRLRSDSERPNGPILRLIGDLQEGP